MQSLRALKMRTMVSISLALIIALVIGCTAKILVSGNRQTNMEFSVTAEPVPGGILLAFSNIPEDIYSMFIEFWDITADGQFDDNS